jgi:Photosystem II protein
MKYFRPVAYLVPLNLLEEFSKPLSLSFNFSGIFLPTSSLWLCLRSRPDRGSNLVDGVLRTSVRGWYTFAHLCFGLLFLFGHWWHASRTLYRDLLSGLESDASTLVEFGAFSKVGQVDT